MTYPMPHPATPTPDRIPGRTKAAVVLLWIMLGIGSCGSVSLPVFGYLAEAWTSNGLQPGLGTAIAVMALRHRSHQRLDS